MSKLKTNEENMEIENDGLNQEPCEGNSVIDHKQNEEENKNKGRVEQSEKSDNEDRKEAIDVKVAHCSSNESSEKIELNIESSTSVKKSKLEITPKKVLSPKQRQQRLDSERKRKERQMEKEEREKKKNEERERLQQEKLKRRKEKEMKEEQKKKEREEKEEQKKKEKEEKEEQRRKEREEKEQKRKEREEKEEQKRKEREQDKLKRQLEIEEKNKEKQKEEEKKQKAAAAFVNFFVAKRSDSLQDDKKSEGSWPYAFMDFEVKSDMKLPPVRREPLTQKEWDALGRYIDEQDEEANYLTELQDGKLTGTCLKTWPFEETVDDDVAIVDDGNDLGESIYEDKSRFQKLRAKFFKFHENRRPAYFGTWRKISKFVTPRRPFAEDRDMFNYEEDSDDDWEEEEQGESLNGSDDEADKEIEDEKDDYEVDNEFFVPHGHLSEDEMDDEENARLSPESLKQKLKLLKDEFDQDMQSKTHKLKPRSIGCIWYNKHGSQVEEAILRYLQPLAMITRGQINIKERGEMFIKMGSKRNKPTKELNPEYIPLFLKAIHGSCNRKRILVEQFLTNMANDGITIDVKKTTLVKHLKMFATWKKCVETGPMKNKFCWLINEDVRKKYDVDLSLPSLES